MHAASVFPILVALSLSSLFLLSSQIISFNFLYSTSLPSARSSYSNTSTSRCSSLPFISLPAPPGSFKLPPYHLFHCQCFLAFPLFLTHLFIIFPSPSPSLCFSLLPRSPFASPSYLQFSLTLFLPFFFYILYSSMFLTTPHPASSSPSASSLSSFPSPFSFPLVFLLFRPRRPAVELVSCLSLTESVRARACVCER